MGAMSRANVTGAPEVEEEVDEPEEAEEGEGAASPAAPPRSAGSLAREQPAAIAPAHATKSHTCARLERDDTSRGSVAIRRMRGSSFLILRALPPLVARLTASQAAQ